MTDWASNEYVAFYFHDPQASQQQLARAVEQIEHHTPYRACDTWLSPGRRVGVLNLCRSTPPAADSLPPLSRLRQDWLRSRPTTNRLRVRDEHALVQTGYVTTPERRFERSLREQGEQLSCADAGGIAAFCLVRFGGSAEERLFLWSTRPSLRAIARAQAPEGLVFGTRPRLVHALSRAFAAPSLDGGYLQASLVGWSLGEHTPYQGTTLLPVDGLVRVQGGRCSLQPHPTAPFEPRADRSLRRQRVRYQRSLYEAVEPLRSLPGFELRLSGGKDSRLVAAVLAKRGIVPSTVCCHGGPSSHEVPIAERVARALGWPLRVAKPEFGYRGGMWETVRYNLSLADGFFATEPRHVAYPIHSLLGDVGPGLVIGHIELQKGGWAKDSKQPAARSLRIAQLKATRWRDAVAPELVQAARGQVAAFAETLRDVAGSEHNYWFNYRFRVGRWLTSHFLAHAREHLPVYPLVDEKVTRVVSCAPLWQLTSERLLADTTWALAPALRDLPLLGEPYRFIVHRQRAQEQDSHGHRARCARPAGCASSVAGCCSAAGSAAEVVGRARADPRPAMARQEGPAVHGPRAPRAALRSSALGQSARGAAHVPAPRSVGPDRTAERRAAAGDAARGQVSRRALVHLLPGQRALHGRAGRLVMARSPLSKASRPRSSRSSARPARARSPRSAGSARSSGAGPRSS